MITSTASRSENATPASAPAEASNSESKGISPLLIGAGALGLALIAILASVLFFMTKKGKVRNGEDSYRASSIRNSAAVSRSEGAGEILECVFEYKANLFDELSLRVGDEVEVMKKYDDGWALGKEFI